MSITATPHYRSSQTQRRIHWFYKTYANVEKVGIREFLDLVNRTYYKHSAECYDERFIDDIRAVVSELLTLRAWDNASPVTLIDIGAGTGLTYDVAKTIALPLKKYVYLEPDQSMAKEFDKRAEANSFPLEINVSSFSAYVSEWTSPGKQFFLLNSTLHHVVWIDEFFDELKSVMQVGDQIAFCHEPQNAYLYSPIRYAAGLWHLLTTDYLLRKLGFFNPKAKRNNDRWQAINKDLMDAAVLVKPMPAIGIRRTIDYWVGTKGDLRSLNIPEDHDEGFWTLSDLQKLLGSDFQQVYCRTYRHLGDCGGRKLTGALNRVCAGILPYSGSVMSVVFERVAQSGSSN